MESSIELLTLTGLKVLDLSRILAGPLCTMMLGDLGADVIKVERPVFGDDTRGWGPPFDGHGTSAYFLSVNRNKLGITADFANKVDVELIRRLGREADVVVENFNPGTLQRYGLDAEAMRLDNRGLVWCAITGFGDSARPGYDVVVQAESGWMSITGEPNGPPMKHGIALADVLAGKDAVAGILAALVARSRTGIGRFVGISLARSAEAALVNVAQNELVSGQPALRWGNAHANLVPYQLFEARDRPLVIAIGNDSQWSACVRVLQLETLAADASLRTNAGRLENRTRVVTAIAARVEERPAWDWQLRLDEVGVPCGLVRTVDEVLARTGGSATTGMPPSVPGAVRRTPPLLGEHAALVRERYWDAFREK